jgi:aminomethyltransferase
VLRPLFGDAVDIPLHHWRQLTLDGLGVYLHRTDPVAGGGYFVMGAAADQEGIWQILVDAGITPAGAEAFDYLRIESGMPRFGREITQEYIPLEAGLWTDVSFNKGCYTGQEVIARMESRGRLAKQLARLHPEAAITAGMEIEAGGRTAGTVTSAATGPAGPVALGYVKTRALDDTEATFTAGDVSLRPQPVAGPA